MALISAALVVKFIGQPQITCDTEVLNFRFEPNHPQQWIWQAAFWLPMQLGAIILAANPTNPWLLLLKVIFILILPLLHDKVEYLLPDFQSKNS